MSDKLEFWGGGADSVEVNRKFPLRDPTREKLEKAMQREEKHPLSPKEGEAAYIFYQG